MSDNRFAQMIKTARDHGAESERPEQEETEGAPRVVQPKLSRPSAPKSSRGRPATGKRSDPDYETTTVFLRRETKTAAAKLLIDDRDNDLSDVLEKLLSGWVKRQS